MLPQKRSWPDSGYPRPKLIYHESEIYELIIGREESGMLMAEVKKQAIDIPESMVTKAIKSLHAKNLTKEVASVKHKRKKIYKAVEFEPSKEISGGEWYQDGELDVPLVKILRQHCMDHIKKFKVATVEKIREAIRGSRLFNTDITLQQIVEIVNLMVLDKEVEELKSSGVGVFSDVPTGKDCYRILEGREGPKQMARGRLLEVKQLRTNIEQFLCPNCLTDLGFEYITTDAKTHLRASLSQDILKSYIIPAPTDMWLFFIKKSQHKFHPEMPVYQNLMAL